IVAPTRPAAPDARPSVAMQTETNSAGKPTTRATSTIVATTRATKNVRSDAPRRAARPVRPSRASSSSTGRDATQAAEPPAHEIQTRARATSAAPATFSPFTDHAPARATYPIAAAQA